MMKLYRFKSLRYEFITRVIFFNSWRFDVKKGVFLSCFDVAGTIN